MYHISVKPGELFLAPGVYNAAFAYALQAAGHGGMYMTGFGTAANYGFPDVGLISQSEMAANIRRIRAASELPLIADADTGYGNVLNVRRTVEIWESEGANGLHMEDQTFPKKCGFMLGKSVIPLEEYLPKLRAACDARSDKRFLIIARTDSLAPLGWDEAERRCEAFIEAGADAVFVDGIRTLSDLDEYRERVVSKGIPSLYNGVLVPPDQVKAMGFVVQLHAGAALGAVSDSFLGSGKYSEEGVDAKVVSAGICRVFDGFSARLAQFLGFGAVCVDLREISKVIYGQSDSTRSALPLIEHLRYLFASVGLPIYVTSESLQWLQSDRAEVMKFLEQQGVQVLDPSVPVVLFDGADSVAHGVSKAGTKGEYLAGPRLDEILQRFTADVDHYADNLMDSLEERDGGRFDLITGVLGLPEVVAVEERYKVGS